MLMANGLVLSDVNGQLDKTLPKVHQLFGLLAEDFMVLHAPGKTWLWC